MMGWLLTRPRVVDWLIRRASRTPYTPIIGQQGELYMDRYWLFNPYPENSSGADRPWWRCPISVRLHRIYLPDPDRHLHDHPWNARTVILRGGYTEVRPSGSAPAPEGRMFDRDAGHTGRLMFGEYHRIVSVKPETWSLFITGSYRGKWGFMVDGNKVYWRTYLGL